MRRILLAIAALPLVLLLGCGKKSTNPSKQILRLNFTIEPPTLDPRKGADLTSSTIQFMLFEGLTKMTPESTTSPALAKRIDISDDKLTYTFYLRDATWSNGDPITSFDVALSWQDMLTPGFPAPNAHLLYPIKNAEAVKKGLHPLQNLGIFCKDDKTLVVTLEQPTP